MKHEIVVTMTENFETHAQEADGGVEYPDHAQVEGEL